MRQHQRIRRGKLQGEQLDITFPRRGRPSRFRRLERAGQMPLALDGQITQNVQNQQNRQIAQISDSDVRSACDYLFPVGPMSEEQLAAEFNRLFPPE
jgi:hypothetical protein